MKRSEMVAAIANFIHDHNDEYLDQLTAAEGLLKFIEDKGMVPEYIDGIGNFWDEEAP